MIPLAKPLKIPRYRLHKPSGHAVVTLNGKDVYLGPYKLTVDGKPDCQRYHQLIAEWLSRGQQPEIPNAGVANGQEAAAPFTIAELIARYWHHANGYYVKNGLPTSETWNIKICMRPLKKLYGQLEAAKFGPLALAAVRAEMIRDGICRKSINRNMGRIKRMFRWATSQELLPAGVSQALDTLAGLQYGRTPGVVETAPVKPVPLPAVDAILPHVSRQVAAMIHLQLLTGARPGEIIIMRTRDIDMAGKVWRYIPSDHKTAHHGHAREIFIGPQAQDVLRPFLKMETAAFIFSPLDAEAERNALRRQNRQSPMTPSQAARHAKAKRDRPPRLRYDVHSYRRAIARACDLAFPPPAGLEAAQVTAWRSAHRWHPHQLRHNAATDLRKKYGIEAVRVILGQKSIDVAEVYAELDVATARKAMAEVG